MQTLAERVMLRGLLLVPLVILFTLLLKETLI
jgi:hypothetical protein